MTQETIIYCLAIIFGLVTFYLIRFKPGLHSKK
jgi:hypothetical protein